MRSKHYKRADLWLSDGWATVQANDWTAPLYWRGSDECSIFTLTGPRPARLDEPVHRVSFYEVDAYARWADAQLPTEAEWEVAAGSIALDASANLLAADHLHPLPTPVGDGLRSTMTTGGLGARSVGDLAALRSSSSSVTMPPENCTMNWTFLSEGLTASKPKSVCSASANTPIHGDFSSRPKFRQDDDDES